MKTVFASIVVFLAALHAGATPKDASTRTLKDRTSRGTLSDVRQYVRGDTGKWNDNARLQRIPPISRKPGKTLLDDWADSLREKTVQFKSGDDNWLLFHSRQLNDNDRLWITSIQRTDNSIQIVASEAVWQGRYRKNFTYHKLLGVNLGQLKPGRYDVTWTVKPLTFTQFEPSKTPKNNRSRRNLLPKNERSAQKKPAVLKATIRVPG